RAPPVCVHRGPNSDHGCDSYYAVLGFFCEGGPLGLATRLRAIWIGGLDIRADVTMRVEATDGNHRTPRFSILIGRVSTEDSDRVLELLDALRQQDGSPAYEVIVADRRLDWITELIRDNYPEVRLLLCAAETPLPELRTRALECARSEYVVVTEDHCVPPK